MRRMLEESYKVQKLKVNLLRHLGFEKKVEANHCVYFKYDPDVNPITDWIHIVQ